MTNKREISYMGRGANFIFCLLKGVLKGKGLIEVMVQQFWSCLICPQMGKEAIFVNLNLF